MLRMNLVLTLMKTVKQSHVRYVKKTVQRSHVRYVEAEPPGSVADRVVLALSGVVETDDGHIKLGLQRRLVKAGKHEACAHWLQLRRRHVSAAGQIDNVCNSMTK